MTAPPERVAAQELPVAVYWHELEGAANAAEAGAVAIPAEVDVDLARGMFQARLYEFTRKRSDSYRGRALLEDVVTKRRTDPWAHFALGALLARGPDARQRPFEDGDVALVERFSNAYRGALRSLRHALELDPQLNEAAEELLRLGIDGRDTALAGEGRRALVLRDTTSDQFLLLSAAARMRGQFEEAAEFAGRAAARGADAASTLHAQAEVLLLERATEAAGEAAYFEGARRLGAAGAEVYWRGLGMIAQPDEAEQWLGLGAAQREGWIRDFWGLRAAEAGVPVRERLAMHFRRVHEAAVRYPLRVALAGAEFEVSTGVDPREFGLSVPGLLLIRHGDPYRLRALGACQFGVPYFLERERSDGNDPIDAFVPAADEMAMRVRALGLSEDLRLQCRPSAPGVGRVYARQLMARLTADNSYQPPFTTRIAFGTALYAFRGPDGRTDVLAALAVPSAAVRALADGAPDLVADLSLVLLDRDAGRFDRSDVRVQRALPPSVRTPGGPQTLSLVQAHLSTTMQGQIDFRVALRDTTLDGAGGILAGEIVVPAFGGGGPELSDLVLAPSDARGTWTRGEVALSPAPGRAFVAGETVQLFYELYGVEEDTPIRTEVLLAPHQEGLWSAAKRLLRGVRNVVHVQFEETARAPHAVFGVQELRTLGTEALDEGLYRVEVRVTDLRSGRTAARTRLIEISAR